MSRVTADTITDEQIVGLLKPGSSVTSAEDFRAVDRALRKRRSYESPASYRSGRRKARARCAEILNARQEKP